MNVGEEGFHTLPMMEDKDKEDPSSILLKAMIPVCQRHDHYGSCL